ncbi:uncharacterized protein tacc2 isoform X2 [Hypomesus transpacificus]|uniref:uncharacterized protein tacc2 isoform X2 n=1 Tax=Hypomesus transpacificus TaxID=137520 RepID=UPI001F08124E|nr:uncharacterized protein tacc2 isoform X2 [Hypomesus transpacificus]
MGNENSSEEPTTEVHAESINQNERRKDNQTDNGAVLTEPPASQRQQQQGGPLERIQETWGDPNKVVEEDKEELEFPHDLLPNLDFGSEFNIWETSLGSHSSNEIKDDQVNHLLTGLQHHMEVNRPPLVSVDKSAIPTLDSRPPPQISTTFGEGAPPLPFSTLLDKELQEAFQECEDQMASLGRLPLAHLSSEPLVPMTNHVSLAEHATATPLALPRHKDQENRARCKRLVNKDDESSMLPPMVLQPGLYNGSHGNNKTNGKSDKANSGRDISVFSFRDYILGIEDGDTRAEGEGIESEEIQEERLHRHEPLNDTEIGEQKDTPTQRQPETDIHHETQKYTYSAEQKELKTEKKEQTGQEMDPNTILSHTLTEENNIKKVQSDSQSKAEVDVSHTKSEKQIEKDRVSKSEAVKIKSQKQSNTQVESKTERQGRDEDSNSQEQLILWVHPSNSPQVNDPILAPATDSSSVKGEGRLTSLLGCPVPSPDLHLGSVPQQSDDPWSLTQGPESPHQSSHVKNTLVSFQSTVINVLNPNVASGSDKGSSVGTHQITPPTCSYINTYHNPAWAVEEEKSALEKASAVAAASALLLTTPTMPEMIECEGEGKDEQIDSLGKAAPGMAAVNNSALEDTCLGGLGDCVSCSAGEGKETPPPANLPQAKPALIGTEIIRLPVISVSAQELQAATEQSYRIDMPHNSLGRKQNERLGELTATSPTTNALSPAGDTDKERESLQVAENVIASPPRLPSRSDCQENKDTGLERRGQGGGGRGGVRGGQEEGGQRGGGVAGEQTSFNHLAGSVRGASSPAKTCLPPDAAESPVNSQCWSKLISSASTSIQVVCLPQSILDRDRVPAPSGHDSISIRTDGDTTELDTLKQSLSSEKKIAKGNEPGQASIRTTEMKQGPTGICLPSVPSQTLGSTVQNITAVGSSSAQVYPFQPTGNTEDRLAETEASLLSLAQPRDSSSSVELTMATVGIFKLATRDSRRVHWTESIKYDDSSSKGLNIPSPSPAGTNSASLPPLTVHESLRHPVTEASFTVQETLSLKKLDTPPQTALAGEQAAVASLLDSQQAKTEAAGDEDHEKLHEGQSAIDHKTMQRMVNTENVTPVNVTENASDETFEKAQLKSHRGGVSTTSSNIMLTAQGEGAEIPEKGDLDVEKDSESVCKSIQMAGGRRVYEGGEMDGTRKVDREREETKVCVSDGSDPLQIPGGESEDPDRLQETPSTNNLSVDPESKMIHFQELPSSAASPNQLITTESDRESQHALQKGPISDQQQSSPEKLLTRTSSQISPHTKLDQPSNQLNQSVIHDRPITETMKGKEEYFVPADGPVVSQAAVQEIPTLDNESTLCLRLPGPMLSHWEFINDRGVSHPGQNSHHDSHDTIPRSEEVRAEGSGQMTQASTTSTKESISTKPLEDSDVRTRQDVNDRTVRDERILEEEMKEDREKTLEPLPKLSLGSVIHMDIPTPEYKITAPQRGRELHDILYQSHETALLMSGSDNDVQPSNIRPEATNVQPCRSEVSIKDEVINVSPPLTSELPHGRALGENTEDEQGELQEEKLKEDIKNITLYEMGKKGSEEGHRTIKLYQACTQLRNGTEKEAGEETELHSKKKKKQKRKQRQKDVQRVAIQKDDTSGGKNVEDQFLSASAPDLSGVGFCKDRGRVEKAFKVVPPLVPDHSLALYPSVQATAEPDSDINPKPDRSLAHSQSGSTQVAQQQKHGQEQHQLGFRDSSDDNKNLLPAVTQVAERPYGSLSQSGDMDDRDDDSCIMDGERGPGGEKGHNKLEVELPITSCDKSISMASYTHSDGSSCADMKRVTSVKETETKTDCPESDQIQRSDENHSVGPRLVKLDFMSKKTQTQKTLIALEVRKVEKWAKALRTGVASACQGQDGESDAPANNTKTPIVSLSHTQESTARKCLVCLEDQKSSIEASPRPDQIQEFPVKITSNTITPMNLSLVNKEPMAEETCSDVVLGSSRGIQQRGQDVVCDTPVLQSNKKETDTQSLTAPGTLKKSPYSELDNKKKEKKENETKEDKEQKEEQGLAQNAEVGEPTGPISVNAGPIPILFPAPAPAQAEKDTDWLVKALRDAVAHSQTEHQNREKTDKIMPTRALQFLESPQAEYRTPTEEITTPLGQQDNIAESPAESTSKVPTVDKSGESGCFLTEQVGDPAPFLNSTPSSPATSAPTSGGHNFPPALPPHLLQDTTEFPTPPPTPPERPAPASSQTSSVPDPASAPHSSPAPVSAPAPTSSSGPDPALAPDPCSAPTPGLASVLHPASVPDPSSPTPPPVPASGNQGKEPFFTSCPPLNRSSDSDEAFETPESTTPVKAASPILPLSETEPCSLQLTTEDTGCILGTGSVTDSDPASDLPPGRPPSRSLSIVFDEDKPIAASGTYNFEVSTAGSPSRAPLTRSLSLQAGEFDDSGSTDRSVTGGFLPTAEPFSAGTESAPGTLLRAKKVRPGSLKKKPLLRQSSNPESPQPTSSSGTPEVKKRAKPRAASPLQSQEGSDGSSPGGTLCRARNKPCVETPPPLPEETNHTSPEEVQPDLSLLLCQEEAPLPVPEPPVTEEESPLPPSGSYKWDPEHFEEINPFNSGGSKIANSPVLGRKGPVPASNFSPPKSPPVPAEVPADSDLPITPLAGSVPNPEEVPILPKRQPVRLEFDYSEENGEAPRQASPPPKKLGKKAGAKMPLRKPRLGLNKAPPPQMEPLGNATSYPNIDDDIPIPKATYNFDPNKWEDPNFNPFSSKSGIPNSPKLSRPSYSFQADLFDDTIDSLKSSNKMTSSPPKAGSASFEVTNDDVENDNDNVGELQDHNQNKPAKKKKTPIKSNTFRVKRSPKRSPMSDSSSQEPTPEVEPPPLQDDHATDEEKLASSTNHKWAALHDMQSELTSDTQDFPQPSDLTSFVNENSLPPQTHVPDYEIEYMEKIGSSSPPLSVKKPSLYLKLESVSDDLTKTCSHGSEPNSPCTGSFEEMEAQITAGMKTPVLNSRPVPEGSAVDKGRKWESQELSAVRDEVPPSQGFVEPLAQTAPLLDRLPANDNPLQYLEPDLAETNPTAFALKLQQREREVASPRESSESKGSLYTSRPAYTQQESPYLPRDLDQSLGIAREEIVTKEKEVLEWQRKYEESHQEVVEMRRIVAEYEKTIAQMIEDEQKEKSLSHHTIQQLIVEKDQALADLNSVEKSLADLFRRYEKMKDVLEGFRKNEEVLKKCAQEYLSRVRKEEQRYQALKIHAEEKLDKANTDIAQVRTKAKQEQAAYQASLRKEQMKVDSLERTLEQKNKEIEELTKICDELIAKMGKS